MKRREILRMLGVGAAALTLPKGMQAATSQPAGRNPNVVYILADDLRPDGVGALGNQVLKTPNMDKIVERGLAFRRAYCMGSTGGAVCIPSRAMQWTGRTLFGDLSLQGQDTWPAVLSRAGYETFITGKWHQAPNALPAVFREGKSIFMEGMAHPEKTNVRDLVGGNFTADRMCPKHATEEFADRAVEFLGGHKKDAPFAMYVAFTAPHDPRVAPKEYADLYDPEKIPLPPNFLPFHPFDNGEMTIRDERLAPWPRTAEDIRRHRADYYACISFMDHHIGRILDCLQETGQLENTILVLAGDNGLSLGDHGLMGKQNLYEFGGMHVPLVLAGPGIRAGQTDAFAYLHDLAATLGELTGTAAPEGSEGKSLAPILADKNRKVRDYLFTAYTKVQRAIRDDRWKLIRYPEVNVTQLFDLEADPYETKNLADDPAQAERVKELMDVLAEEQKRFGDKAPLTVENPKPAAVDLSFFKK